MSYITKSRVALAPAALVLVASAAFAGDNVQEVVTYPSSVTSVAFAQRPLMLRAELNYDASRADAPIAVVMHGYSPANGNFNNVRANAQRLRDSGFFAISVAMRDRDGSEGQRDSGGVEVHDIYDAVEFVKAEYAGLVDPTNVHITGYSGGGGNVMSAMVRYPDYFRAGSSYFGISDYGFDESGGWWFNGASSGHRGQMLQDIGDAADRDDDAVIDRYMARASNLASRNNPYSEIHLFHNRNEPITPRVNHFSYLLNAQLNEDFVGEFDNVVLHEGGMGVFVDFDGDGVNDPGELQDWPHGFPNANQQAAGEQHYLGRLLSGEIPEPVLNDADTLTVIGYVVTRPFTLWIEDGQSAVADLAYEKLDDRTTLFEMDVLSSDEDVTGTLTLTPEQRVTAYWLTDADGEAVGIRRFKNDRIEFELADDEPVAVTIITPDFTGDSVVDSNDLAGILTTWSNQGVGLPQDLNADQVVNVLDLGILLGAWD